MNALFFYSKQQFFKFKSNQIEEDFQFLGISKLLTSQKIDELDEDQKYYVDISSMVAFLKSNDSMLLTFEQLIDNFGENVTFICDKKYQEDAQYLFRYTLESFWTLN